MSTQSVLRRFAAVVLLMILAALPSVAQTETDTAYVPSDEYSDTRPTWRESPLMKKFESQLAWKVLNHWTNRMNDYKSRIDRVVSPCDLDELNRLRVYWSMFIDEKKWEGIVEGIGGLSPFRSGYRGTEMMQGDGTYDATYGETGYDTAVAVPPYDEQYAAEMSEPDTDAAYYADTSATYEEFHGDATQSVDPQLPDNTESAEAQVMTEMEVSGDTPAPEVDMAKTLETVDKVSEVVETFFVAKWIARRYRPQFDRIRESATADFTAFLDTLVAFRDDFVRQNSAELANYPDMRKDLESFSRGDADKAIAEVQEEEWAPMVYNMVIEPLMLLYNGQDLRGLLRDVEALPTEITTLDIPEMSALRQNAPNPASSTTTIPYVLKEPSSRTMLRLYNARGEMVMNRDLGSRPAGEQQVDVNVSDLPTGSYLYHLTLQTASGEQVHSKTMQVVR